VATFSKRDVPANQMGPGTEWRKDLDGYTVSMVTVGADTDLTPLLSGLPDDRCPCPHWGVVTRGSMWFRYGDREEVIEAGGAFYAQPGHTAGASEGAEFVIFSPSETMATVDAHMAKRAQELFGAHS
jgi:hypothetical protein